LSFSERLQEIRTGFERPFWVANISELFERLSYYAVFAVLARYLHEVLHFDVERASSLTGMFGGALSSSCVTFLPAIAIERGIPEQLGLQRMIKPARGIRAIDKKRMILNDATPHIEVDPETYEVRADGVHLTCEPATVLPMAQRYFLY